MKKIIVFLVIIGVLALAAFIFRASIKEFASGKKDQAVEFAIKKLSEKYGLPENVQSQIKDISKNMDPKMMMQFLADPQALAGGKTEGAAAFMNSPDGKKLMDIYSKYFKGQAPK